MSLRPNATRDFTIYVQAEPYGWVVRAYLRNKLLRSLDLSRGVFKIKVILFERFGELTGEYSDSYGLITRTVPVVENGIVKAGARTFNRQLVWVTTKEPPANGLTHLPLEPLRVDIIRARVFVPLLWFIRTTLVVTPAMGFTESVNCVDCGAEREISPSDKHLVTRCKPCQGIYRKAQARDRARERRKSKKNG